MILHPSQWLSQEDIDLIQQDANTAESKGHLSPAQLDVIKRNRWFKMFIPPTLGGLGLSLPEVLRIEEGISWADGSTGWVVTLCSGAGWFAGFLDPYIVNDYCKPEDVCLAGSGAATGTAEETEDGYLITGSWKYASGALHATAFTANCALTKNGEQLHHADGSPVIKAFIFKKEEVTLLKTWNSMGMIATGSHSFEVEALHVKRNRAFEIDAKSATLDDLVYKYPFLQLAETTLAVNLSGMASRFIDLCEETFNHAPEDRAKKLLHLSHESRLNLDVSRQDFYTVADQSWQALESKCRISEKELEAVSQKSHQLVRVAREQMNFLYPHIGLRSAALDSEINRVWRNFNTAILHGLFSNVLI